MKIVSVFHIHLLDKTKQKNHSPSTVDSLGSEIKTTRTQRRDGTILLTGNNRRGGGKKKKKKHTPQTLQSWSQILSPQNK